MAKSHLKLVTPATVNRTVTPKRLPNDKLRTREYLTEAEVERLTAKAKGNRHGHRDATMILVAYRHGLRVSELVDLRWDQVDFYTATLHVRRVKQGTPSTHPILGDELRALRRLQREQKRRSPFVFLRNEKRRLAPRALLAWSSGQGTKRSWGSKRTHTCSGTLAAMRWPTRGTIRGRYKRTLDTATFSIRLDTPSYRRSGSEASGETDHCEPVSVRPQLGWV